MNENSLIERKVDRDLADTIGIGKGGINFDNAGQVMEYAKLMAASGSAVPKHLRGQPGACLGILDDAIRFRVNPYALARKSYFVNDILAYEAQVFMAIVNAHAPLKVRPEIRWEGEGPDRRCIVIGSFRDGAVRDYRSPRFADIQPKNSPLWKNDPDQQQSYFSLRAFARRWCPEVILGIHDVDELRDAAMTDVTPKAEDSPQSKAIPRSLDEFAAAAGANEFASGDVASPLSPDAAAADMPTASAPATAGVAGPSKAPAALSGNADELIAKALGVATDEALDLQDRLGILDGMRESWANELPGAFIDSCLRTAAKVAQGELKKDAAKKYLKSLKD
jgi:hypothetical protein